ncbi:MAG TPA: type I-E CRISPR-associated protein Cas6/Cse3/CasE [Firmicutes bacterium]|jgi:CRISPR system Cascade subunit CasE|nr:type I-E CRISPR-associated protein Cas6/Cse3/CasE [Bacillota bacterium]
MKMDPLYMLELEFDIAALYRFLHTQGLSGREDDTELGYGLHAWLGAAFGDLAPKPWRLLMDDHRPPRILGYAPHDAGTLHQRISEFAEPSVLQVCPKPQLMIVDRAMPAWQKGRRLGFQLLVCPVGRKSRDGTEKDLFLVHADSQRDDAGLCREAVYCDWARQRFNDYSVTIDSMRLAGFRLVKQTRQTQSSNGKRVFRPIIRPQALLEGNLTIQDPDEFTRLLRHGVGRHRAFGYGMILLRPPS